jgi:hypothetical protein
MARIRNKPKSNQELDVKIRVLREIASSAGLPQNRVSLEVLYLLPTEFIEAYTTLFFTALREDAKGTNLEPRAGVKAGKTKPGKMSYIQGEGTKRYRNAWTIRNEKALKLKTEVDRRLRDITQDIELGLKANRGKGSGEAPLRCNGAGCGRYIRVEWIYCPNCGSKIIKTK